MFSEPRSLPRDKGLRAIGRLASLVLPLSCAALAGPAQADGLVAALPAPAGAPAIAENAGHLAVLSGGCFWGVQGVFEHVKGVRQAVAGYSGGAAADANYETVSTGRTGHAESVEIDFDPQVISYGEILRIFFTVVEDPTELDRQGPDVGSQYRSEIFFENDAQKRIAQGYVAELDNAHAFSGPVVTRVDPLHGFYSAEAYHQNFLVDHPDNPYIVVNDLPKLADLKRLFPDFYRAVPVTVGSTHPAL
jgi:peptide-methionine (S)-S-oxide reductase